MIDRGKHDVLGVNVDAVDYEAAVSRIDEAAKARRPLGVSALAVHGVMTGALDRVHRHRLNRLDMVVPDGQPVRWALNLLHGAGLPDRVYGPTLMLHVCRMAAERGYPVFLYGSGRPVLESLIANLTARFPRLSFAGTSASRFRRLEVDEKEEVIREIESSGAAILFVALGCPLQEVWVYEHLERLNMPMIAVGAAFDFHAKRVPQAPPWMQRAGLEWLYRLVREPRRLWRRYLLLNPAYVCLLLAQAAGLRIVSAARAQAPSEECRYG